MMLNFGAMPSNLYSVTSTSLNHNRKHLLRGIILVILHLKEQTELISHMFLQNERINNCFSKEVIVNKTQNPSNSLFETTAKAA